jgi:hypothetical protein
MKYDIHGNDTLGVWMLHGAPATAAAGIWQLWQNGMIHGR